MGLILATIANLPQSAAAANRGGLWIVVHDICVPAYQSIGVGFPCAEVSIADGLERGFAVLRAPSSVTHVIVVPTTPISGIESPALQGDNAPNYWAAAWDARRFVEEGARRQLPRDKIGMAINSAASRSQDQLHIHVACIAPKVTEFLPASASCRPALTQVLGNYWPEFEHPPTSLLTISPRSARSILDIPITQREPKVEPDSMSDDVRWKSVAGVGDRLHDPT